MKLIVAVSKTWGIGKDGDLLFHFPEDMKYFRETTKGSIVIMGRTTLDSLPGGEPLKGRVNIVLTRNRELKKDGVNFVYSIDELLREVGEKEAFVIGGAEVYTSLLQYCDEAYVTKVDAVVDADKYIPNLDELPEWKVTCESDTLIDEKTQIKFSFLKYENNGVKE